jgi:hypothetical protein
MGEGQDGLPTWKHLPDSQRRPEMRHDREGGQTSGVVGGKIPEKYTKPEKKGRQNVGNNIVKGTEPGCIKTSLFYKNPMGKI